MAASGLSADSFVHAVPQREEWVRKEVELGLADSDACRNVIDRCLTPRSPGSPHNDTRSQDVHTLDKFADAFGTSTAVRWRRHSDEKRLLHVRSLVLLSFLHVLGIICKYSEDKLQTFIGWMNDSELERKAILRSIPCMHDAVRALLKYGWSEHRVAELFVICKLPSTEYR